MINEQTEITKIMTKSKIKKGKDASNFPSVTSYKQKLAKSLEATKSWKQYPFLADQMAAIRKLRKCAKFVASLFTSRKPKKESTIVVKEDSSREEAIRCNDVEEFEFHGNEEVVERGCQEDSTEEAIRCNDVEEFEFQVDQEVVERGCMFVYPVFGRGISELNRADEKSAAASIELVSKFEDRHDEQSSEETESEIEYCSWEPDLSELKGNPNFSCSISNNDDRLSLTGKLETSAAAEEEFERCLWKPKRSELSSGPLVDKRHVESKLDGWIEAAEELECGMWKPKRNELSSGPLVDKRLAEWDVESKLDGRIEAAEEFEHGLWKLKKRSELSSGPLVDMRLDVWDKESKLSKLDSQIEAVCSLKQERKRKISRPSLEYLFRNETRKLNKRVRYPMLSPKPILALF